MAALDLEPGRPATDSLAEQTERADTAAVGAGLDALEQHAVDRAPRWRRFLAGSYPPLIALLALLGIWQFAYVRQLEARLCAALARCRLDHLHRDGHRRVRGQRDLDEREPRPDRLRRLHRPWLTDRSGAVPVPLAAVGGRPLLTGLQSLPSVSWVPMAVLWFGLTNGAIYAVVLLGAVPSIANGLLSGMDQVPPLLTRVGKVLGLGQFALIKDVLIPASLPGYLSGLRQGWAFSWRSLMAAELIATSSKLGLGLGQLMEQGRDLLDPPTMYTALILIFIVGIGIELIFFRPVERAILRARGLAQGAR